MTHICSICGYIYDDAKEATPFAALAEAWSCPLCGAPKLDFEAQPAQQQESVRHTSAPVVEMPTANKSAAAKKDGALLHCDVCGSDFSAAEGQAACPVCGASLATAAPQTEEKNLTLEDILAYNRKFVADKGYERFATDKYPNKRLAIVTCMDTRLIELLPAALGIKNGDAKIIKNAGGVISNPFGSAMRSLLIAIYELGVDEIMVIGHTDCGVSHIDSAQMLEEMKVRGINQQAIDLMRYCGIDFERWLAGFETVEKSVAESVDVVIHHPLVPRDVHVSGYVMDSYTGALTRVCDRAPKAVARKK